MITRLYILLSGFLCVVTASYFETPQHSQLIFQFFVLNVLPFFSRNHVTVVICWLASPGELAHDDPTRIRSNREYVRWAFGIIIIIRYSLPCVLCRPRVAVVVVKKRINTRFFAKAGNRLNNPPPGTIIDDYVTKKEW